MKYRSFFLTAGLLMTASEIWKQYVLTFLLGNGSYNWWYFPFQLCSVPMYICLVLPWIRHTRIRRLFTAFLVDFGLLGGIFAFFDTSGMHYDYAPLTVHSFVWHFLLIAVGLTAAVSDPAACTRRTFGNCVLLYLLCCLLATGINLSCDALGTINMFYINPDYPMTQKVFIHIADSLGNTAGILTYIAASILGAGLFHVIWQQVIRLFDLFSKKLYNTFRNKNFYFYDLRRYVFMKKNNRVSHTSQAPKSIVTTKDTTKAIETRAGILKDAPEAPKKELETCVYLQYLGTECNTADIIAQVKNIWTKELGKKEEDMKSIHVYLKPEEMAAYYVVNDETTGKITL